MEGREGGREGERHGSRMADGTTSCMFKLKLFTYLAIYGRLSVYHNHWLMMVESYLAGCR